MITREMVSINISFDSAGTPLVTVNAVVSDTDEQTSSGMTKVLKQAAITTQATQLRDAVLTLAQNAGKPLTFPGQTI